MITEQCNSPEETFALGERIGARLKGGEVVLLYGGLGAGKTLLTKGILNALDFDIDEVTSPSFTLVNLYRTERFDVYHIDLWRVDDRADAAAVVGLDEILENERNVVVVEWGERLGVHCFYDDVLEINISGDGDETRVITVQTRPAPNGAASKPR